MIWPFSKIKALEDEIRELGLEHDRYATSLEKSKIQLLEKTQAQAKEIAELKLLTDRLQGQVHSATLQLARKEEQLQQALKNDNRGAKGRYVGTTTAAPLKAKTPKPKKGS